MANPIVAIVGRPNVGKSTLFNRIIQRREAIVDSTAGVTRDRNYSVAEWCGREFMLVDTGGYLTEFKNDIDKGIKFQVEEAIDEADLVLFLVDIHSGITRNEQIIADMLLKGGKPTMIVANKVDASHLEGEAAAFYRLGFGDPFMISALHGTNSGDLLDEINNRLPADKELSQIEELAIPVAVLGRPNVGKSSIVNALLGREKMLVTDIPGTTRDSVDSYVKRQGQYFKLIDTAGLRKKPKVYENIEYYSTLRTIRSLDHCDITVIIVDVTEGLARQDMHIIELAAEAQKGIILVLNKWDLVDKDDMTFDKMHKEVSAKLKGNDYIEVISTSALTKQRIYKMLDLIKQVHKSWKQKIETSELNRMLERAIARNHPPAFRGKQVSIKYVTQTRSAPPVFTFFSNKPMGITEAYRRYLVNRLRDEFGFNGIPTRAVFKKK